MNKGRAKARPFCLSSDLQKDGILGGECFFPVLPDGGSDEGPDKGIAACPRIMQIPVDRRRKSLAESHPGSPAEFLFDPGRVHRVTPVMTLPVGHETDQVAA